MTSPGGHHGLVEAFTNGVHVRRVASGGPLNSPWGLALAPAGFGPFAGQLLVGNFGDGHVIGYRRDGAGAREDGWRERHCGEGQLLPGANRPATIEGLWGLDFGNEAGAGPLETLYFAAGPAGERHGLFRRLDIAPGFDDD